MNIEHSKLINDFIMFFIETKIDGELRYEAAIDFYQQEYVIKNLETQREYYFEIDIINDDEVVKQVKLDIEKIAFENDQLKMNIVNRKNFETTINDMTIKLLEMATDLTWNRISDKAFYVITKLNDEFLNESSTFEKNKKRKKRLEYKDCMNLKVAVDSISQYFDDIYLIELFIFKSHRNKTIIEIVIMPKSELEEEYEKSIANDPPMIHCKVSIPPYIESKTEKKFDINWQLGTLEYRWKMFWKRLKFKRERMKNVA